MERSVAAVILAAGRGTRMKDNSHNKVCFDCAGVPVIRRVIGSMRRAGVGRIVVVVGHMAEDVMEALDGVKGIFYAYQKDRNGSGSAAMIGLRHLAETGYDGPVIISVGDKIVDESILKCFVDLPGKAIYGVQPSGANPKGGRVAFRGGRPYGIYEFADAAMLKVWPEAKEDRRAALVRLGMSESKIDPVLNNADRAAKSRGWFVKDGRGALKLCGETFFADELLDSPYTNLAIYRLDLKEALAALEKCTSENVQGEIYITDTMEYFASKNEATLQVIENSDDKIFTYSTKPELIEISRHFMRSASALKEEGDLRKNVLIDAFIEKYGDKKALVTRAPGRVNILGRHIDHRGGSTNVMAIGRDTMMIAAPRGDRTVNVSNTDPLYPDCSFDIDELTPRDKGADWLSFIESEPVRKLIEKDRGAWYHYVMAAVARFGFSSNVPICGMDIMVDGNIPVAAGLSSSSSIVVASAEAIAALNCLALTDRQFVETCGEGEWFVGTRGGAGDHAAMKYSEAGRVTKLGFKPLCVGKSVPFSKDYAIVVADSNIKSKKSDGSRDKFNEKVASYEISFMLMKKYFPEYDMIELRDAAKIRPYSNIYKMLKRLPEEATREEIKELLPEYGERLERIFANHKDPPKYSLRGVALFGISECARSDACLDFLGRGDYAGLGALMKISHDGDRVTGGYPMRITDEYLIKCAEGNADIALQPGAYGCSIPEIDALCDMLDCTEGVLGSQLIGAGLGGCVAALVEAKHADTVLELLKSQYYDKHTSPISASVYLPGDGSSATF